MAEQTPTVGMQRKLAAIFSTDVAGYSRLTALLLAELWVFGVSTTAAEPGESAPGTLVVIQGALFYTSWKEIDL